MISFIFYFHLFFKYFNFSYNIFNSSNSSYIPPNFMLFKKAMNKNLSNNTKTKIKTNRQGRQRCQNKEKQNRKKKLH